MIKLPKTLITSYNYVNGAFGVGKSWYTCREQFHSQFLSSKSVSFFFKTNGKKNLFSSFFKDFENKIGIKSASVKKTDSNNTYFISPGEWWFRQKIRFSLFSVLCRCAMIYNGENFEESLFSQHYTIATKNAVLKFLAGNTWYCGYNRRGWYDTFCGLNNVNKLVPEEPTPVITQATRDKVEAILKKYWHAKNDLICFLGKEIEKNEV